MGVQLISYDLRKPGRDYSKLFDAIKSLGVTWHCLESVWLVTTRHSSAQVRDAVQTHLDGNDKLVVLSLGGGWATKGLDSECSEWLRTKLAT